MTEETNTTEIVEASPKSSFKGVSWNKRAKKWQVVVNLGSVVVTDEEGNEKKKQKSKSVGLFADEIEAAKAFNSYITENQFNKTLNEIPVAEAISEELVVTEKVKSASLFGDS